MGKASKWFRGLLGLNKKTDSHSQTPKPPKEKRRWSFVKSYREKDHHHHQQTKHNNDQTTTKAEATSYGKVSAAEHEEDANKHAIAVAAATAAAAEAAVAAAHAAAAVVRLTSSGRCDTNTAVAYVSGGVREEWAALKIQAAFRGSLVSTLNSKRSLSLSSHYSILLVFYNISIQVRIFLKSNIFLLNNYKFFIK